MITYYRWWEPREMGRFSMSFHKRKEEASDGFADERQETVVRRRVFVNRFRLTSFEVTLHRAGSRFAEVFCLCSIESQLFSGDNTFRADCETSVSRQDNND